MDPSQVGWGGDSCDLAAKVNTAGKRRATARSE